MQQIVECIPNFSEGRDRGKIRQLFNVGANGRSPVRILDFSADPDHHRSVITFLGEPDDVAECAFQLAKKALEIIDLNEERGIHPFIGAIDVIPFVPIKNISMEEVVELARNVGKRIADELELPVYLYEEAALREERKNLAVVRWGGYELLKKEIEMSHRTPDFGPRKAHPTGGATCIGAREPLIAYNINLGTNDIKVAKRIACNIREKDGGLPGIKALGLHIHTRNIVQVSINIVDHKQTSIKTVFDRVKELVKAENVEIIESELIGLIPQDAAFENMDEYLQLKDFSKDRIIENYLF